MDCANHVSAEIDLNKFDLLSHYLILFIIKVFKINEACVIKKHKLFWVKFTNESKSLQIVTFVVNLNPGIEIFIVQKKDNELAVCVHCLFSRRASRMNVRQRLVSNIFTFILKQ